MKWYLGRLYTVDLQKRLTHTVTHTRKRADGSSGNRDVKEYFNSSENDQKRPENDIFRIFLLFVISRSGVRVRLPAPIFPQRSKVNMGEFPSGQRGQTVNLLSVTSVVRIHLPPPKSALKSADFCFIRTFEEEPRLPTRRVFAQAGLIFLRFTRLSSAP